MNIGNKMSLEKNDIFASLLEWFRTLNLKAPHGSAEELSDGVALAQALNQFSPDYFTDSWLSKIKSDVVSNWRLKMSNLKKVVERVYDYYNDVLNYSLINFTRPDAVKIAEKCDMVELERLLELILGCAVNCLEKQNYIKQIMCLEESLQQNIMKAIQSLEATWQGNSLHRSSMSSNNSDFKRIQEERDNLAQKCFEYEKQIHILIEEKSNMQFELTKLQDDLKKINTPTTPIGSDGISLGPIQSGSARYTELRHQLDHLKEELLQSETARDDLKIKNQQLENDLSAMHLRLEELTKCTAEFDQLKDEIDVLRESNDKLKVCETQLGTFKKKLQDYNDLKKHVKMLEERSAEYIQQNSQYQEDSKKYPTLKGQLELFKKEIQDLHLKLDSEANKNIKLQFDIKNLENNINALQRTKDTLLKERENLQETIDELKCGYLNSQKNCYVGTMSRELQSTISMEKIQRLEMENKILRDGQGGQTALMQLLDDAYKRNENLREQLKDASEQILLLTHISNSCDQNFKENEIGIQLKQLMEVFEEKTLLLDESLMQNSLNQCKITQLESDLVNREQELVNYETKYRKCIEKAKEIIKNLDPRIVNVMDANITSKTLELNDISKSGINRSEEKLMTTAFYRLAMHSQRDSTDAKLTDFMVQGQTFLSRQRQSTLRNAAALYK